MNSTHDPCSGRFARTPSRRAERISKSLLGNVNAVRDKNVARLFMRRRVLKAADRWALVIYREYLAGVESDKADPSEGESRAGELAAAARTCEALLLARLADEVSKPEERLGLLRELRGFMTTELRALALLGLSRRARPVPTLAEYLKDREATTQQDQPPAA